LYFGFIGFITVLLLLCVTKYSLFRAEKYGIALSIIAVLATIIPATDIAVNFVNWVLCKMIKPSLLPKLDFENGIPEEYATMVVIPALLPDENRRGS